MPEVNLGISSFPSLNVPEPIVVGVETITRSELEAAGIVFVDIIVPLSLDNVPFIITIETSPVSAGGHLIAPTVMVTVGDPTSEAMLARFNAGKGSGIFGDQSSPATLTMSAGIHRLFSFEGYNKTVILGSDSPRNMTALLTTADLGIITPEVCLTPLPLPVTSNFPLNYARIGYDNTLLNGTASASSDSIGSANMLTPSTYDKWRPVLDPSDCELIGTSQLCDYVGIAAHNLVGSTVVINVSDGGALTEIFNDTVTSNTPLFIRFTEDTFDRVFIEVSGVTTAEIGVVYLGLELEMMRPNYSGYSPLLLSSQDVFTPQKSDGGQFLGRQLVRKGFATQASFRHLEYSWYEAFFQPFVEHAKTRPFFWAWNLLEHPDEIGYGWTNQNIKPTLMGVRNWLEVSFDIDAHGNT